MLNRFLEFGIKKGYFCEMPMKDIEKSCCKETKTKAIDFDNTKIQLIEEINRVYPIQETKSCDALKILSDKQRIDFIEFKSLRQFLDRIDEQNADTKISEKVEKFDIISKIDGSGFIISLLLQNGKFNMTKNERAQYYSAEKNYFIVVDIAIENDGAKNFAVTMQYLSETASLNDKIIRKLKDECISVGSRLTINKPVLLSSNNIDSLYASLESAAV